MGGGGPLIDDDYQAAFEYLHGEMMMIEDSESETLVSLSRAGGIYA
jgi:hypothetical protein